MAIIHYFSDRERKKLNIKIFSAITVIIGVIAMTYILATTIRPKTNNQNNVANNPAAETKKTFCIDKKIGTTLKETIETKLLEKKIDLEVGTENCNASVVRNPLDINAYNLISNTLYIPVTNRFSKLTTISKSDLLDSLNSQKYKNLNLIWSKDTDEFLRSKYDFGVGQTVYSENEIQKKLVQTQNYIAIVPFEKLNPTLKVLDIDNINPVFSETSITNYPLTDSYWYSSEEEYKKNVGEMLTEIIPVNNFDNTKLTSIVLTGSSLVGSDAYNINILIGKKPDYMVNNLLSEISKTDILHVSNEVSIYNSCIQKVSSTYLCSLEKDFQPFKTLGVDIVGVTGNHIMDFGYDTFVDTLDWYTQGKIEYFGAGKNEEDAHKVRIAKVGNIKFGFIGYNFIPPYSYYSSGNRGGSANVSLKFMKDDIENAKKQSDVVIVDMNWGDELQSRIDATQRENAKYALEYGATIVNGVNSYKPLGIDTTPTSSTFYGLGGFINPQATSGMIVRHHFYDKTYLGYDLTPISYGKDKIIVVDKDKIKSDKLSDIYKQSQLIYDKN